MPDFTKTLEPTNVWRTPGLIRDILKKAAKTTLLIHLGNDTSRESPSLLLLDGELEKILLRACNLHVSVWGPEDFMFFKQHASLPKLVSDRVWSNVSPNVKNFGFSQFKIVSMAGRRILIGGLISHSLLTDQPATDYTLSPPEKPTRAIHRLKSEVKNIDWWFWVGYLDKADLEQVEETLDENSWLIWVKNESNSAHPPSPHSWQVLGGNKTLLLASLFEREGRKIEESIHHLPLEKASTRKIEKIFSKPSRDLKKALRKPLRVLGARQLMPFESYRFSTQIHAYFAKRCMGSDLAFVDLSGYSKLRNDRVLSIEAILNGISPELLREYTFSGFQLKKFISALLRFRDVLSLSFAGGSLGSLGSTLLSCTIDGYPIDESKSYSVTLSERLFKDQRFANFFEKAIPSGQRGLTLWDAWLEGLPKLSFEAPLIETKR